MRFSVVVIIGLFAAGLMVSTPRSVDSEECYPTYLNYCQHWGRADAGEVIVGIKYYNIDPALVASVAAEWSRSPVMDLRVVGPATYESCLWTQNFEAGVISVCGDGNYGECCPMGWIGSFINDSYPVLPQHITGASVHVVSYYGPEKMRHSLCHEIGHALGLNHPTVVTPGCMGGGSTVNGDTLPWQCPDARDFELLAALYAHIDGFSTAAPVGAGIPGVLYCGVAPSPTPTATPSPTVTASPTPTVTPTPTPCTPPSSKRCRQSPR